MVGSVRYKDLESLEKKLFGTHIWSILYLYVTDTHRSMGKQGNRRASNSTNSPKAEQRVTREKESEHQVAEISGKLIEGMKKINKFRENEPKVHSKFT